MYEVRTVRGFYGVIASSSPFSGRARKKAYKGSRRVVVTKALSFYTDVKKVQRYKTLEEVQAFFAGYVGHGNSDIKGFRVRKITALPHHSLEESETVSACASWEWLAPHDCGVSGKVHWSGLTFFPELDGLKKETWYVQAASG